MFFFRRLKPFQPPGVKFRARERFIRSLLMAACIALVCWGFWENSGRYIQKFNLTSRIGDSSELLADSYKRTVSDIMGHIDKKYGIKIQIKISPLPITVADAAPDALLVGVCPGSAQFELFMPPAWQEALGLPFLLELRDEVMRPAFDKKTWETGLIAVLERLERRLGQLAASQQTEKRS